MYTYVSPTSYLLTIANDQFYCSVVIDAILTIAIAFGLWKSKTGWSHTDVLIKRIIMFVFSYLAYPVTGNFAVNSG